MAQEDKSPHISVAVPAYNEINTLPELYRRLAETLDGVGVSWELVVADDMSTDGTRNLLRGMAERDPRVRAVLLSRNFGFARAQFAALAYTSGTWTVIMDCDLQDEPEAIPGMLELAGEGHEVVYSVRSSRGDGRVMRFATAAFYRLLRRISEVPHPDQAGPFSILSRRVVDEIVALPERNLYLPGMRAFVGFDQAALAMHRPARSDGKPRFTPRAKLSYGLNAMFAFSNAPLRLASWLGLFVAAGSAVLAVIFAYLKYFTDTAPPGFTAVITVVLFLGGIQLLTLGVIGEYIGRIYNEVKRRPRYVVGEALNLEATVVEGEHEVEAIGATQGRLD